MKIGLKENDVEIKILREDLNEETVHLAEGFDGISSEGIEPVTEEVYAQLEKFGLKQLAIRQVGFDNQDLEAAKNTVLKLPTLLLILLELLLKWELLMLCIF